MKRLKAPSPALVISIIALVMSMAGTGYAAFKVGTKNIKNGAVTTKKLHNGAVTQKKLGSGLSVANANALGGSPPSAYQSRVRWAEVEGNGAIDAQSGGVTVSHSFAGEYYVDFGSPVAGHAISATMEWRSGLGLSSGNILVGRCGGGTGGIFCVQSNNTNTVYVQTANNTNTATADRAFTVIAY